MQVSLQIVALFSILMAKGNIKISRFFESTKQSIKEKIKFYF